LEIYQKRESFVPRKFPAIRYQRKVYICFSHHKAVGGTWCPLTAT